MAKGWMACCSCNKSIHESYWHIKDQNNILCTDCAFLQGKMSEQDYLHSHGIFVDKAHAAVRDVVR